jgi:hypothetical protein
LLKELKYLADEGKLMLHRYSKFEATVWISTVPPEEEPQPFDEAAELEAAVRTLAEARPPFPEFQDAGEVEVLFTPDELVRLLTGSRLGVQEINGKKAYARLVTHAEYLAWLEVERIKTEARGHTFPTWTEAEKQDLARKIAPIPEEFGNRLLGIPDYR